jgi:hypothetical protein
MEKQNPLLYFSNDSQLHIYRILNQWFIKEFTIFAVRCCKELPIFFLLERAQDTAKQAPGPRRC